MLLRGFKDSRIQGFKDSRIQGFKSISNVSSGWRSLSIYKSGELCCFEYDLYIGTSNFTNFLLV
jgi:hypothetical protein